eukprot:c21236_g1_i1 orf=334-2367(-)
MGLRERSGRNVKVLPVQHPSVAGFEEFQGKEVKAWGLSLPGSWQEWLHLLLPCSRWMRSYQLQYLRDDVLAGVSVGTMIVPQAMSYAKLAGLHPIYGLYSGFIPVFAYAIFGSSRQLAIGPVALVSLLVSNSLTKLVDTEKVQTEEAMQYYSELAVLLALIVGVMECLMGLFRLGWLIRFISHTVISGFTSASAVVIALSQAKYFLGYDITRSSKLIPLVKSIIDGSEKFTWHPFVMGSFMLLILLTMKHLGKTRKFLRSLRAAGPLTALVSGMLLVKVFHPSNISVVGSIPQGLPHFSVPLHFSESSDLLGTALLITGVAILESVGIAKVLAAKNGYEVDSNQELFGLGMANMMGSFFSSYPTTGSFSRSAVNHESGAKTGLSGIVTGVIIGVALLFFTNSFVFVPQCSLAAIVVSAVVGLIDYDEAFFLWRVDKRDFLLWLAAFINTLFFGIEIGVLVAVGLSLAFVIYESANPHVAILGRLPGTTVYRNIKQYPEANTYSGIVIIRIDSPMYFANISFIKDRLRKYEIHSEGADHHGGSGIRYVIIEMAPVTYIDSSAVQALKELYLEYKTRNIQMALSNPNHQVMLTLAKSGIPDIIGKEWYFVRVHDAMQVCLFHMQKQELGSLDSPGEENFENSVLEGYTESSGTFMRESHEDITLYETERQPLMSDVLDF